MKAQFLLSLLVICFAASAQFSDTVNYHVNFAGTGNINKTNTGTNYIFNNALKFDVSKKHLSLNSMASYIYGQNPTQKTNNDFLSVIDVDLFKSVKTLYYWGLASYEKSFSLKVDNRFQAGAGVGYKLVTRPRAVITLSDGILFETSDLAVPDQYGRNSYQTVRNSFRLKFRFVIRDVLTVDGVDFLQNSLSDGKDYIIKSNTNLSVKIYKWLNLTMAFNYNRLNLTKTENLLLSYGLMFERYF